MKYRILYLMIFALLAIAFYDPTTGEKKARFKIKDKSKIGVDYSTSTGENDYLECVWNTGDTAQWIDIDTPGMYVVSMKDRIWLATSQRYGGPYFVYGIPDSIDMGTKFAGSNGTEPTGIFDSVKIKLRRFDSQSKRVIDNDTLVYAMQWISGDTFYWQEPKGVCTGFWSGFLDTVYVRKVKKNLVLGVESVSINNQKVSISGWDAAF